MKESSEANLRPFRVSSNTRSVSRPRINSLSRTELRIRSTSGQLQKSRIMNRSKMCEPSRLSKLPANNHSQARLAGEKDSFSSLASQVIRELKKKQEKMMLDEIKDSTIDVIYNIRNYSKKQHTMTTSLTSDLDKRPIMIVKRTRAVEKRPTSIGSMDSAAGGSETRDRSPSYFRFTNTSLASIDSRVEELVMGAAVMLKQMHMDQYLTQPLIPKSKSRAANMKPVLVLDLDETLVHCCNYDERPQMADTVLTAMSSLGRPMVIYLNVRPHTSEFLKRVINHFKLVVFTSSELDYATAVCRHLDPAGQYFSGLYTRDSCLRTEKGFLVKDLRIISGSDTSNIFLVDNLVQSFSAQIDNGIPIVPFTLEKNDTELLKLADFLDRLRIEVDKRGFIKKYFKMSRLFKTSSPDDVRMHIRSIGNMNR